MSTSYCIKCKSKTDDINPQVHELKTSRGTRYQRRSTCKDCSKSKCQFISVHQAQGQGLITDIVKAVAPGTADTINRVQQGIGSIPMVGLLLGAII